MKPAARDHTRRWQYGLEWGTSGQPDSDDWFERVSIKGCCDISEEWETTFAQCIHHRKRSENEQGTIFSHRGLNDFTLSNSALSVYSKDFNSRQQGQTTRFKRKYYWTWSRWIHLRGNIQNAGQGWGTSDQSDSDHSFGGVGIKGYCDISEERETTSG